MRASHAMQLANAACPPSVRRIEAHENVTPPPTNTCIDHMDLAAACALQHMLVGQAAVSSAHTAWSPWVV